MKKDIKINPIGLKGNQINERMKELMGMTPINENKTTYVIELTKVGPDGKAYAIVRENHEYYIKTTDKKENILPEDFNYIGGLKNKKSEAYPSYAKAIKHLNLKFNSLSEAYNFNGEINVFKNDSILKESGVAAFSQNYGNGFTGEGNLENNSPLYEDKAKNNPWAICSSSVGRENKEKYEACVKDVKKEKGIDENLQESEYNESEEELTEVEKAVDDILERDKMDEKKTSNDEMVNENHKLTIKRAIKQMDSIIDGLSSVKKKVYSLK